jgi:hypothetical protein
VKNLEGEARLDPTENQEGYEEEAGCGTKSEQKREIEAKCISNGRTPKEATSTWYTRNDQESKGG